ncbi:MAG TPA: glycine zipper 2TM domain-containing protein [Burkholderiales bacterium]|nr:glycine zipper 2TM domain-containing protein [Burkholderiales bacterium]
MSLLRLVMATLLVVTVAACATPDTYPGDGSNYGTTPAATTYQPGYGVVQSVAVVEAPARSGIGAGAVAGGVVGAILGSQVGHGTGRAAATVAGAGGGAYVGHQIERRVRTVDAYQLTLRMDDGTMQTIVQDNRAFQVGDRVQVTNDGRVILL